MKGSRLNFKKAYINPKNQIQTSLGWLTDKQLEVLRSIAKLHGISDQHALAMWNALGAFIRKNVIEKSGENIFIPKFGRFVARPHLKNDVNDIIEDDTED
jgi:hypothetical protein